MPTVPPSFAAVPLPSRDETPLSPTLEGVGLELSAPLSARASLPICGSFELDASIVNRFSCVVDEITLVAIDAESHRPFAATLPRAERSSPIHLDESVPELTYGGWFNVDLRALCGLPDEPATYYVFALVAELQSSVCRVSWEGP
jgi:hypothetical protein